MAQAGGDKIKLGYWKFRGLHRGNCSRYLLAYSGAQWENQMLTMGSDEWATLKASGTIDFPNLPFLIDGDVNVTETVAVQRYICDKFKPELLGNTAAEKAKVSQLYSIFNDKIMDTVKLCFNAETTREQLSEKALGGLEACGAKILADDRQFVTGANPCLADFLLFEEINYT